MTSHIARRVVRAFGVRPLVSARHTAELAPVEELSEREMEILKWLSEGYLYKEISDQLGISYATVRTHIERIYRKLHVQSRAQAVAFLKRADR